MSYASFGRVTGTSGVVSGFVEKVTFVGKLPTLVKATSDDESPTPGYLYQEINAMLHESSSQCQHVLDFLVDRLNKDSFHVKVKVLRVMRHLTENGPAEFQQGLRRRSEGIKAATSYSGPPDPLHGHAPYVLVRKTATELSAILFNTENCEQSPTRPVSSNNRPSVQTGMGPSQTSPGRMQGFGNTAAQKPNKSLGTTILNNLKGWTEGVSGFPDNQYQPIGGQSLQPHSSGVSVGGYKPALIDSSLGQPGTQYSPQVSPQRKTYHKAGKAGGGWEDSTSKHLHGNNTHSKSDNSGDSTELSERLETVSVEDRTHETQLVADFTDDHGQSATKRPPSRDELQQFVKRCSALNCDVILQLLNDKLSNTPPHVQLKILFVLEHLLKTDLVTTEQLLELYRPALETLSTGGEGGLQAKATKILRQLTFQPPPAQKTEEILQPTIVENRTEDESMETSNAHKFQTSLFSGMKLQSTRDKLVNIETNASSDRGITATVFNNQDAQGTGADVLQEGSQLQTSSTTVTNNSHLQDLLFLDISDQSGRTEHKSLQNNNNLFNLDTAQENTATQDPSTSQDQLKNKEENRELLQQGSGVLKESSHQLSDIPQKKDRSEVDSETSVSNFIFLDRTESGGKHNDLKPNGAVESKDKAGKETTGRPVGPKQSRNAPLCGKKNTAGHNADPFNFVQDAMQAYKK